MKHLKLFQTEAEYTAYKDSEDFVLPNVSYAVDGVKLYYNPLIVEPYTMVDLGLSVKWADRNVGATSPEEAGLYFQWGDTVGYTAEQVGTDKVFNWANYFDTTDGGSTFTKYATDKLTTLEATDDAATVHMGGSWRMPTEAEIEELINGTTQTRIDIDGNEVSSTSSGNLKGVRLTSKTNGNSIFIPAAGLCYDSSLDDMGSYGYLWTSSLNSSDSSYAHYLYFNYNSGLITGGIRRRYGLSVRGVCK